MADDSGIAAAALDGRPGVRSARYAGEDATDEENLAKLLDEVPPGGDTRVAYECVLAYVDDEGELTAEGSCEGELTHEPRGDGGFGYDPAFVPADLDDGRTMAELVARREGRHQPPRPRGAGAGRRAWPRSARERAARPGGQGARRARSGPRRSRRRPRRGRRRSRSSPTPC